MKKRPSGDIMFVVRRLQQHLHITITTPLYISIQCRSMVAVFPLRCAPGYAMCVQYTPLNFHIHTSAADIQSKRRYLTGNADMDRTTASKLNSLHSACMCQHCKQHQSIVKLKTVIEVKKRTGIWNSQWRANPYLNRLHLKYPNIPKRGQNERSKYGQCTCSNLSAKTRSCGKFFGDMTGARLRLKHISYKILLCPIPNFRFHIGMNKANLCWAGKCLATFDTGRFDEKKETLPRNDTVDMIFAIEMLLVHPCAIVPCRLSAGYTE